MSTRIGFCALLAVTIFCVSHDVAQAQPKGYADTLLNNIQSRNSVSQFSTGRINQQIRNQAVPTAGVGGVNRQNFIGRASSPLSGPTSKPFSTLDRGPTVSPYLTLSNPFSTPSDFYNIVRPQQEQRRVNDQLLRQQYAQNKRLNQMAAQGPFQITGNENAAPTGHGTARMEFGAFLNTGGFFPPPTAPKER
ncbi:MAG: hypothetical protein SH868_20415 [Bythopirellula sp.]|nr:hypothetical protein [Bythopirellula sp.]